MRPLAMVAGLSVSAAVSADTLLFTVSNDISPEQPSALITVWAEFDPDMYALAAAAFEVRASEPGLSDPERLLKGPGSFDGWLSPDTTEVTGILDGQIHGIGGIFADTSNPIAVWQVTWTATDFAPRTIDLSTSLPSRWDLFIDPSGSSKSFLDLTTAGSGSLTVVPSPGAEALLLAASLFVVRSQRRGRSRSEHTLLGSSR